MAEEKSPAQVVQKLVDLLPILSDPNFAPCEWEGGQKLPNGSIQMPYPTYCDTVDEVFRTYSAIWIHPYELLPEDPQDLNLQQFVFTPEYFEQATYDQTRRYFSLISRRERFHDGCIEGEIQHGILTAAIRRLAEVGPRD